MNATVTQAAGKGLKASKAAAKRPSPVVVVSTGKGGTKPASKAAKPTTQAATKPAATKPAVKQPTAQAASKVTAEALFATQAEAVAAAIANGRDSTAVLKTPAGKFVLGSRRAGIAKGYAYLGRAKSLV